MARKLYLFIPSSWRRMDARPNGARQWLGGFSTDYAFLGDFDARLLGVGNPIPGRRQPIGVQLAPLATRMGRGASRLDRSNRSWG